jgi:ATP-dependent Lon protease
MVIPLFVGRERSIVALNKAMDAGKRILLVAQKTADLDDPQPSDLYEVGTLATILQLLKLPDGTVKVLVEGGERALIDRFNVEDHFSAEITPLAEDDRHDEREIDVLVRSVISQFEQYVKLNKKVPPEVLTSLSTEQEGAARGADLAVRHRRAWPPGGHRCRAHGAQAFREAAHPRDTVHQEPPRAGARHHRRRDRCTADRETYPREKASASTT